jgi:hypothetical protein
MSEMSTLPFRFKWISASPDSQNKTMRNNLEPDEVFVQVDVPLKAIFIANAEPIIQFQLGTDNKLKEMPEPILTPNGLAEAHRLLSAGFLPQSMGEAGDEDWDETAEDASDDDWDENTDDDDDGWEDE